MKTYKHHGARNWKTDYACGVGVNPDEIDWGTKQAAGVTVGAKAFGIDNYNFKNKDKVLVVANNREHFVGKVISSKEWENFEDRADIDYSRHPAPWHDANAIEKMARAHFDVDSHDIGWGKNMYWEDVKVTERAPALPRQKADEAITALPTSFDKEAVALDSQDDLQAAMESNAARQKGLTPKSKQADER